MWKDSGEGTEQKNEGSYEQRRTGDLHRQYCGLLLFLLLLLQLLVRGRYQDREGQTPRRWEQGRAEQVTGQVDYVAGRGDCGVECEGFAGMEQEPAPESGLELELEHASGAEGNRIVVAEHVLGMHSHLGQQPVLGRRLISPKRRRAFYCGWAA